MASKNRIHFLKTKKKVKQIIPNQTFDRLAGKGKQFSKNQKEKIGRDLVKRIRKRTEEQIDINEEDFLPYGSGSSRKGNGGEEYLRRKERILGKKINPSNVDIKLFDKLLKSIKVKVNDDGDLEILHKGSKNNLKALSHVGNKGDRPNGVPKREYFGVRISDIKDSAEKFEPKDVDVEE